MNATVPGVSTYLDHAATTPPRPAARAALQRWLEVANPSSTHLAGQAARVAVEQARDQVAGALGCSPHEVVFTAGATEADNLAIKGVVWAARDANPTRVPHVVTNAAEHPAVLQAARWLAERGDATLTVVPVRADGSVDVEVVLDALRPETVLVSVMAANNEIGTVNDVSAIAAAVRERGVAVHCDAVQLLSTRPIDVAGWGIDALAVSGHKLGAPTGVGVAVLRRGLGVVPLLHGGGQDRGVRSGTLTAALDAACGAAVTTAVAEHDALHTRLSELSERLAAGLVALDGVRRHGPVDPAWRLASHVHITIEGVDAVGLSLALDQAGIAVSGGSACGSGAATASHVLVAVGATGAPLRLSLGWTSTANDVELALDVLTDIVPRLRRSAPMGVS